jgi:saccharopine dehydrogenase (NAD+, L-lysine forming)
MDSVLIIGAGAAGSVTAQKAAMNRDVFKKVTLASRRLSAAKTSRNCAGRLSI